MIAEMGSAVVAVVAEFDFPFFKSILFGTDFVQPALLVLGLTLFSQTAGIIIGFPLALGRISRNPLVRAPANFYLFIFRGTPLLLQILFVYDGLAEVFGPDNPIFKPLTHDAVIAGAVTLALNEGAYMAEIIRSGLQAVDPGQLDAARALGMRRGQYMRRIVIPQALRVIVPPTTNEYINMSKNTSLLVVISVNELLNQASRFYSANFRYFESLAVAAIWYLAITTILTRVQAYVESRFGERNDEGAPPGFMRRMFSGQR
ncbi:MAG: amino acid ABC transporter permease [Candidatus Dormibacteria bacterium]